MKLSRYTIAPSAKIMEMHHNVISAKSSVLTLCTINQKY